MKKSMFVLPVVAAMIFTGPMALAADSPQRQQEDTGYVQVLTDLPILEPTVVDESEIVPMEGVLSEKLGLTKEEATPTVFVNTTTKERLRPGVEIRLFDYDQELQGVVPEEQVTFVTPEEIDTLPAETREKFEKYYEVARAVTGTTLVNYFWLEVPEKYEALLRTREAYTDDDGNSRIDGEYLELNIVKPGTNVTCTVNGKDMEVEDLKDGTVTLKLTETGAVAVFAEVPTSEALSLTADSALPKVIPDPYMEYLVTPEGALAICEIVSDEQRTAVSTKDVTFIPVEYITLLDEEDQLLFLQAFEDVRDNPVDGLELCYFFWLGIPDYYEDLLSGENASGGSDNFIRLLVSIPGENIRVIQNGSDVEIENVEADVYALKLTGSGAVAVYTDDAGEDGGDDGWYRAGA